MLCYPEERAENFAGVILHETVSLGFRNRGVKQREDLYVLNKTNMPAILVESAFCDSEIDMKNYNPEAMDEGDTLWALSRKYGVTPHGIIELNNIKNPNLIYPGQRVKI